MTLILHKRSNTHLKVPLVSDLASGELSINTYDGRLFIKKTVSSVDSIVTISNDYADLINTPTFSTNYGVTVTTVGTVVTIGTPQDLQTTASPTFAGANINGTLTVTNNANTWTFNSDGEIQLPSGGDIVDSSGASVLGGGGSGGGGLSPTPIKTSAYTAVANDLVRCNSTASSFSVTLPLNPPDGAIIGITDVDSNFNLHPVTLLPNTGKTIEHNSGIILDISGTYISVVYVLADLNWKILETPIIHHDGSLNPTAIISNTYVASDNDLVRCDSSANSFSITFPGAPVDGTIIGIVDSSNSFATHNVTLYSNTGKTIDGNASQVLSTNGMYISFIYIDSTSTWRSLGASSSPIADQTGNTGKLLSTNGAITNWLSTTGSGNAVLATSPAISTSITTASTTFNLINTTATTVTFAGAANAISVGSSTGTTTINHDLQVAGDIYFNGTANRLSGTNLDVTDSLIYLSIDNVADTFDIGWVGGYQPSTTHLHTGLVRDATDGIWKLFSNISAEPTTTIDFTSATYDTLKVGTLLATTITGNLSGCTFPTLNQNTSGTAAGLSATLAITSGGTGATSASAALTALGAQAALVSGTSIKTINSTTLLGSGDISVGTVTSVSALTITATGTDITSSVATGTSTPVITLNIPTASATNRGVLSTTDWTTFNGKQAALVSGTSIKTINSTTLLGSGDISVGTVTSVSALTITATGTDITSSVATGTSTPVITLNIPTASATNRGVLSTTDWTTFNGKQAALVSGTSIKTVNGTALLGSGDVTISSGVSAGKAMVLSMIFG